MAEESNSSDFGLHCYESDGSDGVLGISVCVMVSKRKNPMEILFFYRISIGFFYFCSRRY